MEEQNNLISSNEKQSGVESEHYINSNKSEIETTEVDKIDQKIEITHVDCCKYDINSGDKNDELFLTNNPKNDDNEFNKQEIYLKNNDELVQDCLTDNFQTVNTECQQKENGNVFPFPNLSDDVLKRLNLFPEHENENHDDIETKFQTLTMMFSIDSITLAERYERQQRKRDQAEENMLKEITKLSDIIQKDQTISRYSDKTELTANLLTQLKIIKEASHHISTSAEVFGSVQQEWRIAQAIRLMVTHLQNLRQQRDNAQRQFEYVKRMLQETTSATDSLGLRNRQGNRQRLSLPTERLSSRRRASIATVPRHVDSPRIPGYSGFLNADFGEEILLTKRTNKLRRTSTVVCNTDLKCRSDWSPIDKQFTLVRTSKVNRFDLGLDLIKIKECKTSNFNNKDEGSTEIVQNENLKTMPKFNKTEELETVLPETNYKRLIQLITQVTTAIQISWTKFVEDGTFHEICFLGAIVYFGLGVILLSDTMIEMELARRELLKQTV